MASVSSLLKSAASRRAAIQQEQNRIADMEWNLSAKTADDYAAYTAHYNKLLESSTPSDTLTYTNKLNSARKSFISSDLQRKSIDVLEGRATNDDKLNTMIAYYQQAVDNGDAGLAQSLNYQIDNLYNTIQTQKAAQMTLATQAANAQYSSAENYISDLLAGKASPFAGDNPPTINSVNEMFKNLGPDATNSLVQQVSQAYGIPMASYSDMMLYMANNVIANVQAFRDAFAPGSEQYMKLDNQLYNYQTDYKFKLAGQSMTLSELQTAVDNEHAGGTGPFSASYDPEKGWSLVQNKVANWSVDANGNLVPNYVNPNDASLTNDQTNAPLTIANKNGMQYTYVKVDYGNGVVNTFAVDAQGNMYSANGFNPEKPGKSVGNVKDYQNAEQVNAKPKDVFAQYSATLKNVGLQSDKSGNLFDANGNPVDYKLDQNGNIQIITQGEQKDANGNTYVGPVGYTLDTKTGMLHNMQTDAIQQAAESARIKDLATLAPTQATALQGQRATSQILQPSGTQQILQNAKDITTANMVKASQLQQSASATQISALTNQPIKVEPLPTAQPIKVQPIQAQPKLTVNNTPSNANVSVYVPPITQTVGQQPLKVTDQQNNTKLTVR